MSKKSKKKFKRMRRESKRAFEIAQSLQHHHMVLTIHGMVTWRLVRELLSEEALDAAVASGFASLTIDPESDQRMYAYVDRSSF